MATFRYEIEIKTDTDAHAQQVLNERLGYDEEIECASEDCVAIERDEPGCGERFDYTIDTAADEPNTAKGEDHTVSNADWLAAGGTIEEYKPKPGTLKPGTLKPGTLKLRTVRISEDAYRVLCGLVQPTDKVEPSTIVAHDETWRDLRGMFPIVDYRRRIVKR